MTRNRARRAVIATGVVIGATGLVAPAADAAALTVTSPADAGAGTLRDAVNTANTTAGDDEITFAPAVTSITLATEVAIDPTPPGVSGDALTITGPGVTISGGDVTRIFSVSGNAAATISGLTLTHGASTDGAAIAASGPLTVSNVQLTANASTGRGGAIRSSDELTITNSTITGNTAGGNGGGGLYASGRTTIAGSTFSGNTATAGGGGAIDAGGGKYNRLVVSDTVVSGNTAPVGGGVQINRGGGAGTRDRIATSTISGNTATAAGGGGGIYLKVLTDSDSLVVLGTTISGNHADSGFGGGIAARPADGKFNGAVTVAESTVSGNSAQSGGGVAAAGPDEVPLFGPEGSLSFENTTVAANSATAAGGGFFFGRYDSSGVSKSPTVQVTSTLIGDNSAPSGPDADRVDAATAGGLDAAFSLVEAPAADAGLVATGADHPSIVGVDPQLGPLAGNGGTTQTQLPAPTSPAVDQGFAPARPGLDQRAAARWIDGTAVPNALRGDGSDIGAVEVQNPPAAGPPGPPDKPPTSTITRNRLAAKKAKRRVVRGRAADADGSVAKVQVAIVRKKGGKCASLRATGRFGKAGSCAKAPSFIAAKGTGRWSFKAKRRLPRGTYLLFSRAVDDAGLRQTAFPPRSVDPFSVR